MLRLAPINEDCIASTVAFQNVLIMTLPLLKHSVGATNTLHYSRVETRYWLHNIVAATSWDASTVSTLYHDCRSYHKLGGYVQVLSQQGALSLQYMELSPES